MVVDFPAPFGPRKPSTSPRSTAKDTPSTARFAPKVFTRLSMRIIRPVLFQGRRIIANNNRQRAA